MTKILNSLLAIVLIGLCVGSGCVTGPDGKQVPDIARISRLIGSATFLGTQAVLLKNPQARPAFEFTRQALKSLQANQNYDPAAFAAAFQGLPISELKGDFGSLYVSLAIVAWDELRAEAIAMDQKVWVASVLDAAVRGFDLALGPSPSASVVLPCDVTLTPGLYHGDATITLTPGLWSGPATTLGTWPRLEDLRTELKE